MQARMHVLARNACMAADEPDLPALSQHLLVTAGGPQLLTLTLTHILTLTRTLTHILTLILTLIQATGCVRWTLPV